jgi:hypothetical protein
MSAGPVVIVVLLAAIVTPTFVILAMLVRDIVRHRWSRTTRSEARSRPGAGPRNPSPGRATFTHEEEHPHE